MTLMISRMGAIMKEDFMETKVDHTAAIFTALSITPEGQPWAYKIITCPFGSSAVNYILISLLSSTLEADGLAVRLVEIARDKYLINDPEYLQRWGVPYYKPDNPRYKARCSSGISDSNSFAAAVHDALCEALEITDKEGKENA